MYFDLFNVYWVIKTLRLKCYMPDWVLTNIKYKQLVTYKWYITKSNILQFIQNNSS